MTIQLTPEETAVLAHVVIDPDAWLAGAYAGFGAHGGTPKEVEDRVRSALDQKVARWAPSFEADKARLGGAIKNRAAREAISEANIATLKTR